MYEVLLGVHNALQTAFRPLRKSVLPVFPLKFQFSQLQPILKIQDLSNSISKHTYLQTWVAGNILQFWLISEGQKLQFWPFEQLWILNLWNFWQVWNFHKNQNYKPSKLLKRHFLTFRNQSKFRVARKLLNFHSLNSQLDCSYSSKL